MIRARVRRRRRPLLGPPSSPTPAGTDLLLPPGRCVHSVSQNDLNAAVAPGLRVVVADGLALRLVGLDHVLEAGAAAWVCLRVQRHLAFRDAIGVELRAPVGGETPRLKLAALVARARREHVIDDGP